jgi:hypothetical protein
VNEVLLDEMAYPSKETKERKEKLDETDSQVVIVWSLDPLDPREIVGAQVIHLLSLSVK